MHKLENIFSDEYYKHAKPLLWGDEPYKMYDQASFGYLWIAEINLFRPRVKPLGKIGFPIIAIARTKEWHRGVFLIPPIFGPAERQLGGPSPLTPVDLSGWTDPVALALQQTDLLLNHTPNINQLIDIYGAPWPFDFDFYFETPASIGNFSMMSDFAWHKPTKRLHLALLECVYHLVEKYDHEEMTTFVAKEKEDFEWLREIINAEDNQSQRND